MKSIKKMTKAVAGSALLVGATLAGGAAMGAAQSGSSGMTLGDYPAPFVDDDGEVDATVVVGESAKTVDVVGGINVAGSLGNAAFSEESVSASGGSYGWSATDGVSLDTRNDALYYSNQVNAVRQTLTQEHLDSLADVEYRDDDGTEYEVTHYMDVGDESVTYGETEDDEDPELHVDLVSEGSVDASNYLYSLQANIEDSPVMNDSDDEDQEIELFGRTYTISSDTTSDELVLLGSQEETSIDTGESATLTINDEEHTFEVVAVTDSDTAAFRVDGDLREEDEDATFNIDGQDVRVSNVVQTNNQNSEGVVTFAVGSEEIRLDSGNAVQDSDGDDIEGTYVEMNGGTSGSEVGDGLSSLTVYVGSPDDDQDYVAAGEMFSHDLFENIEFHFGGLNPDSAEGGDDVGEMSVGTSGDDTATVSFTGSSGEDATVEFGHVDNGDQTVDFTDSDGNNFVSVEGANVTEDDYFATDAGDFSHMWEVTSVDRDQSNDEATVELQDVVTGDSVEVDFDSHDASDDEFTTEEIIDGQTYHFALEDEDGASSDSVAELNVAWDGSADFANPGVNTGDYTSVYTPVDTDSGAALSVVDDVTTSSLSTVSGDQYVQYELPSTESSSAATVNLTVSDGGSAIDGISVSSEGTSGVQSLDTGTPSSQDANIVEVNGGQNYVFYEASDSSMNVAIQPTTADTTGSVSLGVTPHTLFVQPEDDASNEHGYVVGTSSDTDGEVDVDSPAYSGTWNTATLDSDDNVDAGYDMFGAYSEYNSDDAGDFMLMNPDGQAAAGAAFTESGGSLDAGGSSGSVMSMSPTGWPDSAALDSDSDISSLKQNSNLVLVGGPAVNNLVSELASDNKTWSGSDYSEGDQVLDLVSDAFTDGNHALVVAGYSGEDTRAAANYIADYADNADELAGQTTLNLATQ